jgi:osmotically-inducible protein OsmY
MKKKLFLLSSLCLLLAACENTQTSVPTDNTQTDRTMQPPVNQAENEADRSLTQKIRQSLMDDDTLSTNAKNVKIITLNGVVTLRGAVNSEREKSETGKKAKAIPGVRSVDNQLEIIRSNASPGQATESRE